MEWRYNLPKESGEYYVCFRGEQPSIEEISVRTDGSVSWFIGDGPLGDGIMIIDRPRKDIQFLKVGEIPKPVWIKMAPPELSRRCSTCERHFGCEHCLYSDRSKGKAGNKWSPNKKEQERYDKALAEWEEKTKES